MSDHCVLFITVPHLGEGRALARALLEARLAACVNLVPKVESLYWWDGAIQNEEEALLVVKTRTDRVDELVSKVRCHHSYSVPEVIAVPVEGGNPDYLRWIDEEVPTPVSP